MNKETYCLLENFMLGCMEDSAHDKEHIYRVLYNALEIAKTENNVNYDVLIAACLLHDIGRKEQFENPALCHAIVGSEKAYRFLMAHGFEMSYAEQVKQCIKTHRYRKNNLPQSIEAKILFDADKLDVAGAIGIARTLLYKGSISEPLYSVLPNGTVSTGENDITPSFFQEYKYKLENLYSNFYTEKATTIAKERQHIAMEFYNSLYQEVNSSYQNGTNELNNLLESEDGII
ncbi:MAG: HD domain-containing protein [Lachnospiraceae bacterium]|nr:HD domain-containing protein [Lachnospiraceae bacterium]